MPWKTYSSALPWAAHPPSRSRASARSPRPSGDGRSEPRATSGEPRAANCELRATSAEPRAPSAERRRSRPIVSSLRSSTPATARKNDPSTACLTMRRRPGHRRGPAPNRLHVRVVPTQWRNSASADRNGCGAVLVSSMIAPLARRADPTGPLRPRTCTPGPSSCELRTESCEPRATNCELRAPSAEPRAPNYLSCDDPPCCIRPVVHRSAHGLAP
jgi:hypothetical protein